MPNPSFQKLLIANRGEIAIRIARTAAELGIRTVAIFSEDDAMSLHVRRADEALPLRGAGAAAYLDIGQIIKIAKESGCDAIHPGYGFLSENADLARRAADAGLMFVGPSPGALDLFGDKTAARKLAASVGVPVIEGTSGATTLEEALAFFRTLDGAPIMIKAVSGGGGRGMRAVHRQQDVAAAYERCRSEASAAFGNDAVYVERLIAVARHIEVQVVADRKDSVIHLWERECTIQRRNQKVIEIAPSPSLTPELRSRITQAALRLARAAKYDNIGTFEFLVDAARDDGNASFAFIEANPRLQVEHTVTEEIFGLDLVAAQLNIAAGASLAAIGLSPDRIGTPRGYAVQLRVNMEMMDANGETRPTGGTLTAFDLPSGPGVRVDTFGYVGYRTSTAFDSLLAKVIAHSPSDNFTDAAAKASRALREFRIGGVDTNAKFLDAIVTHPDFVANRVTTHFVETHSADLVERATVSGRQLYFDVQVDSAREKVAAAAVAPPGTIALVAPLHGTLSDICVDIGEMVRPGQQVALIEAMKMEHLVTASQGGIVQAIAAKPGTTLAAGAPVLFMAPVEMAGEAATVEDDLDLDHIRADLLEMRERHAFGLDTNRPEAVARRRKTNQRTARENIAALVDEGSFIEYGSLAIAAQRARRTHDDLIRNTPGDGVVVGLGSVNGAQFSAERARCAVVAYDYTVLAGTQGQRNHKKQDRLFKLAAEWHIPVVLFAEGGGGRPGDTERLGVTGLDVPTFTQFAGLSGLVPLIGVVSGRCFAGNAALLGCCDVIVATKDATLGMGGPAMIEGGGLGVYKPEDVGPVSFQVPNGVIDILVEDEVAAAAAARLYLSYFQGRLKEWSAPDQRLLRRAVPENRLRVYDIRHVIETLADEGSLLELRPQFGIGIVTAFIRIEGQAFGLLANNPKHLGGAIDSDAGDKAARFMQLCDAFDIPIVSLCDTPGFMVGPEAEKTALVRHVSRMFVTAASLSVPYFTVVLRKGYGLGAQAMAGGGFHAQCFTISWPTGEFGGMGFEGAVRLGFRKEMEAIADPVEREKFFKDMVAKFYETGKAINIASVLEIDQVIDPIDTRDWIIRGLRSVSNAAQRTTRKRPCIDTW
jgi:acetyl/propionyl-CoA carboxylase alpha subunit/acetyl-CoA carboxylase carboxyltransferase component